MTLYYRWDAAFAAAVVLLVCTPAPSAIGEDSAARLEGVTDRGELLLEDGTLLCFPDLSLVDGFGSNEALARLRQGLDEVTAGRSVRPVPLAPAKVDRYGCTIADVETADGISLQQALVVNGLAAVRISPYPSGAIEQLLSLEREARHGKRGRWRDADSGPKSARDAAAHIGSRQLVEGRVRRVSGNDRYVYLNFGADWRTDFTARIDRKLVDRQEVDPDGFEGEMLRIRGFVQEAGGPLIDIANLKQIEVLP